nr:hypothetical protein [Amanita phalloides]
MLKNLLKRSFNTLSIVGSTVTILEYIKSTNNKKFEEKYEYLKKEYDSLEKFANDVKLEGVKNELTKTKIENLQNNLELSQMKANTQLDALKNLEVKTPEQKEAFNSHLEEEDYLKNPEFINKKIDDTIKELNDQVSKFFGDSNIVEILMNFIQKWSEMLSTLSY